MKTLGIIYNGYSVIVYYTKIVIHYSIIIVCCSSIMMRQNLICLYYISTFCNTIDLDVKYYIK